MRQSLTVWIPALVFGLLLRLLPYVSRSELLLWTLAGLFGYFLKSLIYSFAHLVVQLTLLILVKRRSFVYAKCSADVSRVRGKTVLITGASTGIGRALGTVLTKHNAKVFWCARTKPLLVRNVAEAGGGQGVPLQVDLGSRRSVLCMVQQLQQRRAKLDYVFLNAAYLGPKRLTEDGVENNFGVNHLGHMYLIYLLLKEQLLAHGCRIVVVASDLHRLCNGVRFHDLLFDKSGEYKIGFRAYNHSKLLNILFSRQLASTIKATGSDLSVVSVHPGTPIQTELLRSTSHWMVHWLLQRVLDPLVFFFGRKPIDGTQTLMQAAFDKMDVNGLYYENCQPVSPTPQAQDDAAAEKLWKISCDMLEVDDEWSKYLHYLTRDENSN